MEKIWPRFDEAIRSRYEYLKYTVYTCCVSVQTIGDDDGAVSGFADFSQRAPAGDITADVSG